MAYARFFAVGRVLVAALCGATLGGFLAIASAQDGSLGQLDVACAGNCTAHGYDADFCSQVCWIPDPAADLLTDQLDWKCIDACGRRGGTARQCMAACPRR